MCGKIGVRHTTLLCMAEVSCQIHDISVYGRKLNQVQGGGVLWGPGVGGWGILKEVACSKYDIFCSPGWLNRSSLIQSRIVTENATILLVWHFTDRLLSVTIIRTLAVQHNVKCYPSWPVAHAAFSIWSLSGPCPRRPNKTKRCRRKPTGQL